MKYDPLLRWWSILLPAVTSLVMAQLIGNLNAIEFAQQMSSECGLPSFSRMYLPLIDSFDVYGMAFAGLIVVSALVGFRVLKTEEARYRLIAVIHGIAWAVVPFGIAVFFLASYALPYAKCAAAGWASFRPSASGRNQLATRWCSR